MGKIQQQSRTSISVTVLLVMAHTAPEFPQEMTDRLCNIMFSRAKVLFDSEETQGPTATMTDASKRPVPEEEGSGLEEGFNFVKISKTKTATEEPKAPQGKEEDGFVTLLKQLASENGLTPKQLLEMLVQNVVEKKMSSQAAASDTINVLNPDTLLTFGKYKKQTVQQALKDLP